MPLFDDLNRNLEILKVGGRIVEVKEATMPAVKGSQELNILNEARAVIEGKVPAGGNTVDQEAIKRLIEMAIKEEDSIEKKEGKIYFGSSGDNLYYAAIEKKVQEQEVGAPPAEPPAMGAGAEPGLEAEPALEPPAAPGPEGESTIKTITLYDVTDQEVKKFENTENLPDINIVDQLVRDMGMDSVSFSMLQDLNLLKKPEELEPKEEPLGEPEGKPKEMGAEEQKPLGQEQRPQAGSEEDIFRPRESVALTHKQILQEQEEMLKDEAFMKITQAHVDKEINEVAPPGWEPTVKKMKKHKDITNPWALSWYMKGKGYKPGGKEESVKEVYQDAHMFEKEPAAGTVKELPTVDYAGKRYYVDNKLQQIRNVDDPNNFIEFDDLDQDTLDKVIQIIMAEGAKDVIGLDPAQIHKQTPTMEAKVSKKELAAAAERTKHAMSFLRKIHKATEAGTLETVMDAIEKAATKGDIDDKQETRLKEALKRKKEALVKEPKETEPTAEEQKGVEATDEAQVVVNQCKVCGKDWQHCTCPGAGGGKDPQNEAAADADKGEADKAKMMEIDKTRREAEAKYEAALAKLLQELHDKKITQIEYDDKCEELKREHKAKQEGTPEAKDLPVGKAEQKEVEKREKKGEIEGESKPLESKKADGTKKVNEQDVAPQLAGSMTCANCGYVGSFPVVDGCSQCPQCKFCFSESVVFKNDKCTVFAPKTYEDVTKRAVLEGKDGKALFDDFAKQGYKLYVIEAKDGGKYVVAVDRRGLKSFFDKGTKMLPEAVDAMLVKFGMKKVQAPAESFQPAKEGVTMGKGWKEFLESIEVGKAARVVFGPGKWLRFARLGENNYDMSWSSWFEDKDSARACIKENIVSAGNIWKKA